MVTPDPDPATDPNQPADPPMVTPDTQGDGGDESSMMHIYVVHKPVEFWITVSFFLVCISYLVYSLIIKCNADTSISTPFGKLDG
jgi:hypothetical protein